MDNGCTWRALPADFPPFQTVYGFYRRWAAAGVITAVRDKLRQAVRERLGRCPNPVTIIIDSQSVKAAETVSAETRGYDAGKKINGRKRHVVVDTKGMIVAVMVTPANVTDRDAAREVLLRLCLQHPEIAQVWAGQGYSGELVTWAKDTLGLMLRISKNPRPDRLQGPARRWIVERSLSWITPGPPPGPRLRPPPTRLRSPGQLDRRHPDDQAPHPGSRATRQLT